MSPLRAARTAPIALLATLLAVTDAFGAEPAVGPRGAMPAIDCKAMTSRPNSPMTFEQCQARMAGAAELSQAMNQPGGERPGDDAMTCEQIVAELKTTSVPGVSRENAAEGLAAGRKLQETYNRQMAKGETLAAAQTARTAAAAGIDVVTGTNVAGGVATAQGAAETAALQAQARAEMDPARARVEAANARSRADLVATWRANPRMARLTQLVMKKNCSIQ